MLYIFNHTEDGINCNVLERHNFDQWISEHVDGIKPEHHPRFIDTFPGYNSSDNEYFIIEGECLIPEPIEIIKTFTLPRKR